MNFFCGRCLGVMFRNNSRSRKCAVCLFSILVPDFPVCHIHLRQNPLRVLCYSVVSPMASCVSNAWVAFHYLAFGSHPFEIRARLPQKSCVSSTLAKPCGWRIEIHGKESETGAGGAMGAGGSLSEAVPRSLWGLDRCRAHSRSHSPLSPNAW